jgi:hypothetical protein
MSLRQDSPLHRNERNNVARNAPQRVRQSSPTAACVSVLSRRAGAKKPEPFRFVCASATDSHERFSSCLASSPASGRTEGWPAACPRCRQQCGQTGATAAAIESGRTHLEVCVVSGRRSSRAHTHTHVWRSRRAGPVRRRAVSR